MDLRPYQQEAREAVEADWVSGFIRTLVVLPTGCGKTIVFCKIVEDFLRNHVLRTEREAAAALRDSTEDLRGYQYAAGAGVPQEFG